VLVRLCRYLRKPLRSRGTRPPAGGGRGMSSSRALSRYLSAGAVGIAVYFLLPPPIQNLVFIGSNLLAAGVVLVRVRSRRLRPVGGWLLLAAFPWRRVWGKQRPVAGRPRRRDAPRLRGPHLYTRAARPRDLCTQRLARRNKPRGWTSCPAGSIDESRIPGWFTAAVKQRRHASLATLTDAG
jgi:hypothetical protein